MEQLGDVGDVAFHLLADDGGFPEEDTGVPEELTGTDEHFRQFQGRFFSEGLHLQGAFQLPGIPAFLYLDVAEVHVRAAGDDAEGHQHVVPGDETEHLVDGGREQVLVPDHKVTGRSADERFRVARKNCIGGKGHARGGLPAVRLQQEISLRNFGQEDARCRSIFGKGDHEDVLQGQEPREAVIGHPEIGPGRRAPGHDDTVSMCIHTGLCGYKYIGIQACGK